MTRYRIGGFEVARVVELEEPVFPAAEFFPDFDPEVVRRHAALLGSGLIEPGTGKLVLCFQSFVVKTGRHTILIDACAGNDKERPARPRFHRLKTPFLHELARAGVTPDGVDYVMCTHLHWDHVGWNTRLADGRWVPTFPKARYVMARREVAYWEEVHRAGEESPHRAAFADSIKPILEAGQAELVEDGFALEDGVWLEPAPGHTPGNVVIHARSGGERGVFMGDVVHHPLQLLKPEWSTRACSDPALSRTTRQRLIAEHAENRSLVLPAHFPSPTAGRIVPDGSAYWFEQ